MLLHPSMRRVVIYLLTAAVLMVCCIAPAWAEGDKNSQAAKLLTAQKEAKILSGAKFKIAKPFIKRTPMGVILDEIEMMIICPIDMESESDSRLVIKACTVLSGYNLVQQIDDERSKMDIYIDSPENDKFSEIILYHHRPEPSIMLFIGDFDVESLIKVGKASEQERKNLKKYN